MARVAALSVVVLAALAPVARADMGSLPNGGTFDFTELDIHLDGATELTPAIELDQTKYFNLAHCVCSGADLGLEQEFQLKMTIMGGSGSVNHPAEVWTGSDCENDQTRDANCELITSAGISDLGALQNMIVNRLFKVDDLIAPKQTACPAAEIGGHVWVRSDTDGDGSFDYYISEEIPFDTLAPPPPANAIADAGENAVQVTWDPPTEREEDVAYYQALCARTDTGAPALDGPINDPRYQSTSQLCPGANLHEVVLTGVDNKRSGGAAFGGIDAAVDAVPGPDAPPPPDGAPPTNLPPGLDNLEGAFICGEETAPASSMRIGGLDNDVEYRVVVLAIDLAGNAEGIYFTNSITPRLVTDFWEDLHDKGSQVEGGFCLIAETYGDGGPLTQALRGFRDNTLADSAFGRWLTEVYYDVSGALAPLVHRSLAARIVAVVVLAPVVALALLWHLLTLPGLIALMLAIRWYRKRRKLPRIPRRLLAVATALVLVALATTASAQSSTADPYWSEPDWSEDVGEEIADPHWHVGLRVGPYIPDIDKQTGRDPGPYEQMFGNGHAVMPVLDVDWLFLRRSWGQLGVGGSVGAMWRSAKSFEAGGDPNDPMRPRSDGDPTNFRLVPLAATVVYRFTSLDDTYGIPIVPYLRGGLSYYIWWIGAPSGNTAVISEPVGCDPDADGCKENRARGASLGVQGSIGLAIRAERVDPSAARSMRQGGVEHAGFYAELQLAKVDGFGNEKKLSVGDTTWFAGVDFEF